MSGWKDDIQAEVTLFCSKEPFVIMTMGQHIKLKKDKIYKYDNNRSYNGKEALIIGHDLRKNGR